MVKYVDSSKADKARRKRMVAIGILPKAKAKEFLKVNKLFGVGIYGIYLDGVTEIGLLDVDKRWNPQRIIDFMKAKVNEVAV